MTGRFNENPIQDRLAGVSFSFYTDDEAKKLSVQQIVDPVAFDHLNNPKKQGLHDKKLGVSPFDHKSSCPTCGMTVNYCPGHVGHIELTAPIYNPFLFKEAYKLLKAKCFGCHRIRIHGSKLEAYIGALKLLKSGDVVHSQELKAYLLYAAKAISLFPEQALTDVKRMMAFKQSIEKQGNIKLNVDQIDLPNFISKLENAVNERKEDFEHQLKQVFSDVIEGNVELVSTSTSQRALLDLQKEIWAAVVTTTCPHCKHKSPAVKKDGYTKLFIKPLQGQAAVAARQNKNIQKSLGSRSRDSSSGPIVDGFEIITNASTIQSRKPSGATNEFDDSATTGTHNDRNQDEEDGIVSSEDEEFKEGTPQKYITPIEVQDHLQKMWSKEANLLDLMYGKVDTNNENYSDSMGYFQFFMKTVIVPPTRFRPESEGNIGQASDGDRAFLHTHSAMLTKVIQANISLSDALINQVNPEAQQVSSTTKPIYGNATQKWIILQDAVNVFMDASMAQKTADKQQQGIRQLLERKEGMFRMKMMGKRVNYGGRSVISPDPMITTDQIGVPVFMAKKLTFPESVSAINAIRLARLIKNGSDVHPGANIVEDEITGKQILLSSMTREERDGVANQILVGQKIVHRHLANGDVLILNRQPTLHKPSMMTHIARILPKEQTLRFHYANCSTYNADFDGDEMNIHLPQSYLAIAEAYELMATHKQYVVPTSGKPIRGLIQDSIVGGVLMTSKDTFFTKEEYMQLVYVGLQELLSDNKISRIHTMPPQIIKPKALWTGKQVISTLLKNIVLSGKTPKEVKEIKKLPGMNLESKSRLAAKEWGPLGKEEGEVIIRDNEHLQGTLDKNQFGANDHGMVHSFYEIYGSKKAGELLTSLARIFFIFLQIHGFTVGLDDLALNSVCNKQRRLLIEKGHMNGMIAAAKFAEIPNFAVQKLNYSNRVVYQSEKRMDQEIEKLNQMVIPSDPFSDQKKCIQANDPIRARLEEKVGQATFANKEHLEAELDNVMKSCMSMATSSILGDCIPKGLIKRFPKNNISTMCLTGAKGGLVNQTQISALLGQQELEGRRVPRMQNGRTLPCYLSYDPNPRSSGYVSDRFFTGLRPQDFFFHCMAGREGLIDTAVKTSRSGYLQRCLIKQLESLVVSYDLTVRDNDGSIVQFMYGDDGIDVMENKYLDKFKFLERNHNTCFKNIDRLLKSGAVEIESVANEKLKIRRDLKRAMKRDEKLTELQAQYKVSEPILSRFHPQRHFGSISEKMEYQISKYIKSETLSASRDKEGIRALKQKFPIVEPEDFKKMYYHKYLKSLVHAGENVGTIAAQSIGEPSTQMTLNTFHLAGHGAANMTLGIPRLKEILMTTPTNIKTPCMTVYFNKELGLTVEQMTQISNSFERIKFQDVVRNVRLCQSIERNLDGNYSRVYKLTLEFENAKQLKAKLGISFNHLCKIFSDSFIPTLMNEALKELRRAAEIDLSGTKNEANTADLKNVLNKTVKATKVSRNGTDQTGKESAVQDAEEEQVMENVKDNQSEADSDREEASVDAVMDEDGFQKSKVTSYGNSDSEMDNQNSNDADGENQNENSEVIENEPDQKLKKDMDTHKKILREKHSKYLQYLKGDFEFEQHKSATVTIQFPLEYKKLLLLSLAESVVKKVIVRSVPGIDRCSLVVNDKGGEPYLFVQGQSFEAFEKHEKIFQLYRIQSNHSYAMKLKYGIEACRANIVKEIRGVFDVYGIAVDYRHLSLISDFITFNGDYRAFNRIGMEESVSPFLKMSYETTMKYLIQSSVTKETDWMASPSSALVLGQVPSVGTGCFDLIQI